MTDNRVFVSEGIINPVLLDRRKSIYILGVTTDCKKIFYQLLQYKVKVAGFIVEKKQEMQTLYGLKILQLDEAKEKNSVYVIAKDEWDLLSDLIQNDNIFFAETKDLQQNEFLFLEDGIEKRCNASLMLTMILSRTKKKKAVFLIHSCDYDFWANLREVLQDEIEEATLISIDQEIEKIYDLMYCDMDKLIIFISVFETKEISEMLLELGFKQTQHFVFLHNSFSGNTTDRYEGFDWLLGNTYKLSKDYPGYYINGDLADNHKKIVVLGNSATDPLFYPQKAWPEMLWEKCMEKQIPVTICNGAITDYNSSNELIKMLRDIIAMKPDIVISYSGFIDFREYVPEYPYLNLNLMRTSREWEKNQDREVIYGIKDQRSAYERWINNEKMMHQICQVHQISFYGVLQPWIGSEYENPCVKLKTWSEHYWKIAFPQFENLVENAKEFKEKIRYDIEENSWLFDFTDIFSEIEDAEIYFDSIHVNEYGNEVVSEKIGRMLGLL